MKKLLKSIILILIILFPNISNADLGSTILNVGASIFGGLEEKPKFKLPKFLKKKETKSKNTNISYCVNKATLSSFGYPVTKLKEDSICEGTNFIVTKSTNEILFDYIDRKYQKLGGIFYIKQNDLNRLKNDKNTELAKAEPNQTQNSFLTFTKVNYIGERYSRELRNREYKFRLLNNSTCEYYFKKDSSSEEIFYPASVENCFYTNYNTSGVDTISVFFKKPLGINPKGKILEFKDNNGEYYTTLFKPWSIKFQNIQIAKNELSQNEDNLLYCTHTFVKSHERIKNVIGHEGKSPDLYFQIKKDCGKYFTAVSKTKYLELLNAYETNVLEKLTITPKKKVKVAKVEPSQTQKVANNELVKVLTFSQQKNLITCSYFNNQVIEVLEFKDLDAYYEWKSKKIYKGDHSSVWTQPSKYYETYLVNRDSDKELFDDIYRNLSNITVTDALMYKNWYNHNKVKFIKECKMQDLLKKYKTQFAKAEPKVKSKKQIVKDFNDFPVSDIYFYAFKDKKNYFIGYLNQDPTSKIIKIGNRKFREGNVGKAYSEKGDICKVYSIVDKPNTTNRTYTGTATLECKNNSNYVGNWVQYGSKGSGKAINENNGESIDFYFTMDKLTAVADLEDFKKDKKIRIAKVEESKQEEFKLDNEKIDNDAPIIEIDQNITVNDTSYVIEGKVLDKSDKLFVEIDGQPVRVDKKGKFKVKRYSLEDEQVKIVAFDQWGNKSKTKLVNITIEIDETIVAGKLEPLNPSNISNKSSNNKVALIIGIENYVEAPKANYANLDAKYFFDYARRAFGVKKQNINLLVNEEATVVKTDKALSLWLKSKIKKNRSDLIIFFAGHGLASNDGKELYLLPQDGNPDRLERTGLSRTNLFKEILSLDPKSVTMFLDTCYSGVSRDEQMLLASARPVRIVADEQEGIPDNFTIFSASQLNQISSGLKQANHGIFSYYLMKGLEGNADINQDNKITNGELLAYMDENVSQKASELGRQQNPSLAGDPNKVLMSYR